MHTFDCNLWITREAAVELFLDFDMASNYFIEEIFEKIDYKEVPLVKGEFEKCHFIHCDFSGNNFSEMRFWECKFSHCNMSLVKFNRTALQQINFSNCKMLGLAFDLCNEFGFSLGFDGCTLNHSSFYKVNLKKTSFKNSLLHEVDFTECNLNGAVFEQCDLLRSTFFHANLEKADLRTSYNYSIDPETNRIKKAKFSLEGVTGLLDKYDLDIS